MSIMGSRSRLLRQTFAFSLLGPVLVGIVVPILLGLFLGKPSPFAISWICSAPFFAWGVYLVAESMSQFFKKKGTPMMFFATKSEAAKGVFGEEPEVLVAAGIYRHSRNPMYLGVIFIALGFTIGILSLADLVYSACLLVGFHLVVVLEEEPHLKQKHGSAYVEYTKLIPRWWPLLRALADIGEVSTDAILDKTNLRTPAIEWGYLMGMLLFDEYTTLKKIDGQQTIAELGLDGSEDMETIRRLLRKRLITIKP
jgi:protein-S-isoprenylcysteine O-methyltransferase Ste14